MPYPSTPTFCPGSPATSSPIPCTNAPFQSSHSPPTALETQSYSGDVPPAPPGTPNESHIHSLHPEPSSRFLSDTRSEGDNLVPDTSSGAQSQQDSETPANAAGAAQSTENGLSGLTESFHAVNIAVVDVGPGYSGRIVPQMDPPTPPLTPRLHGLDPPTPPPTPP